MQDGMEMVFALNVTTLVFLAVSFLGNTLVIIVLLRVKSLRGVTSCLLLSLSFADLILGLSIVPNATGSSIVLPLNGELRWIRRVKFYCNATLCAFTLVGIAAERYLAVLKPFYHKVHVTKRWACKIIVVIWLLSAALSVPGYVLRPHNSETTTLNSTVNATRQDSSQQARIIYEVSILCTFTVVPAALMSMLYGRIIYRIWLKPDTQGTNTAILKARRKMTKLLLTVTVAFYLCWLPLLLYTSQQISEEVKRWLVLFPLLNTALNPILYCLHSDSFRQGVKSLFCSCCKSRKICANPDGDGIQLRTFGEEKTVTNL